MSNNNKNDNEKQKEIMRQVLRSAKWMNTGSTLDTKSFYHTYRFGISKLPPGDVIQLEKYRKATLIENLDTIIVNPKHVWMFNNSDDRTQSVYISLATLMNPRYVSDWQQTLTKYGYPPMDEKPKKQIKVKFVSSETPNSPTTYIQNTDTVEFSFVDGSNDVPDVRVFLIASIDDFAVFTEFRMNGIRDNDVVLIYMSDICTETTYDYIRNGMALPATVQVIQFANTHSDTKLWISSFIAAQCPAQATIQPKMRLRIWYDREVYPSSLAAVNHPEYEIISTEDQDSADYHVHFITDIMEVPEQIQLAKANKKWIGLICINQNDKQYPAVFKIFDSLGLRFAPSDPIRTLQPTDCLEHILKVVKSQTTKN